MTGDGSPLVTTEGNAVSSPPSYRHLASFSTDIKQVAADLAALVPTSDIKRERAGLPLCGPRRILTSFRPQRKQETRLDPPTP
jgi:hypothetical protein